MLVSGFFEQPIICLFDSTVHDISNVLYHQIQSWRLGEGSELHIK